MTVHNSDPSSTGSLAITYIITIGRAAEDTVAWNPRDAPMYKTKGAEGVFCYTTVGADGRLVVTPRTWSGG